MCAIVDILLILIVILFILLIWRGPSMLPQLGEALGKAVKGVRESVDADAGKRDGSASATSDAGPSGAAPDNASASGPRDGGPASSSDQDAADSEHGS
jgi:Sec-independent protein translocase protein TatA